MRGKGVGGKKEKAANFKNKTKTKPINHFTVWKLNLVYWVVPSSLPLTRGRARKNTGIQRCWFVSKFVPLPVYSANRIKQE